MLVQFILAVNCRVLWRLQKAALRDTSVLYTLKVKSKAVPLQASIRFPDFVTTAQDGGRLSALCTGHLYPQQMLLVLIPVRD